MADLSTTYLGLKLKNPVIVSSSPLTAEIDNIRLLEEAGAGALVLPSLFEEQVELDYMGYEDAPPPAEALPPALQYVPNMKEYNQGARGYLALLYQAKRAVNIPVIASLNGYYGGGWVQYARLIEAAGADALELNIYYMATRPQISSEDIERMYLDLVRDVKANTRIPIAVKISPYFSAMANMAQRLDDAGADSLVLFNRFFQPDFDLETRKVVPTLDLSQPSELRLRLRWVAILYCFVKAELAVTGGVHSAEGVLKSILAGARVAMMTSALMVNGIGYLSQVLADLDRWLEERGYSAIGEVRGSMCQVSVADPAALERANYMEVLRSY
jgi:dihydroorotate dehydrogenase (fumarate)